MREAAEYRYGFAVDGGEGRPWGRSGISLSNRRQTWYLLVANTLDLHPNF
jgi:hypothetical protein